VASHLVIVLRAVQHMASEAREFLPDGSGETVEEALARRKQVRNTCIAAFSNLSTAYNLVNINLAHVVLQNEYCDGGDKCPGEVTTASTACLVGAIVGQLTFGYVGDCLGRGRALQLTMMLSIFGALVSAFAFPLNSSYRPSVFTFLSISRFVLGIGVGGVYPLAATIAAESSTQNTNRGRAVSIVFSMQGIGTLLVPLVGMAALYGFGTPEDRTALGTPVPGLAWRFILGIGALPGIILLPFKTRSSSSESSTRPSQPVGTLTVFQALGMRKYWKSLVGCAGGWFLFDITFYGNTLFQPTVLQAVFGKTDSKGFTPTIGHRLETNLCEQLVIIALIGLPGYYIAAWLMDKLGRKNIQLQGFVMMAVLYGILGIWIDSISNSSHVLLLIIYGLTFFFSNFGPNSTTFILPSESFPFEVRTSLNGFCAASGKAGAAIGSALFKPIQNATSNQTVFLMCAACSLIGVAITAFCIDDRRGRGMQGESFIVTEDSKADA